jgi:hypothetical protein
MLASHKEQVKAALIAKWNAFQFKNELAQEIVHDFIFGEIESNIHIPIEGVYEIVLEIQNDMSEVNSYMSGTKVIEDALYKDNGIDKEATLVSPAVYYTPSTQEDLVKFVDPLVLELVMGGQTWAKFVASFKTE